MLLRNDVQGAELGTCATFRVTDLQCYRCMLKKRWRRARRRKVKYLRGGGCVFMFNWGTRMMVEQIHFSPLSIAVLHFSSLVHVQLCMCCQIPGNTPKVGQGRCRGVERIQEESVILDICIPTFHRQQYDFKESVGGNCLIVYSKGA